MSSVNNFTMQSGYMTGHMNMKVTNGGLPVCKEKGQETRGRWGNSPISSPVS